MKIIKFIIILLPWFLSGLLFNNNLDFYNQLNLPFFALPKFLFSIVWTILYIFISISIFIITKDYGLNERRYNKILLINYVFNQLFLFCFFTLENLFLGFIDTILIFITSLFLYDITKILNEKATIYLKPYIIFNIYAIILNLTIYFMNL